MFKINTFIKLVKYIAGYILVGLGIFTINNLGVANMILGEDISNKFFYPFYSLVMQWTAVVVLVALPLLIIYSIFSYANNKGRKDYELNPELKAARKREDDLINKLDELIKIMGDRTSETTKIE